MAAGSTYTPIATTTLSSSASTITFSSISGSCTDLVLVLTAKAVTGAYDVRARVGNGSVDTGTNYSYTSLYGTGTSAASGRASNSAYTLFDIYGYVETNNKHVGIYQFMNYSNNTTYKTIITRSNNAGTGVDTMVSLWRSTSAINIIELRLGSGGEGSFDTGTVATLYGITAA